MSKRADPNNVEYEDYLSKLKEVGQELGISVESIGTFKALSLQELFYHSYIKDDPIIPLNEKQIDFNNKLKEKFLETFNYEMPLDRVESMELTGTLFLGTPGQSKTAFATILGKEFSQIMGLTFVKDPNKQQLVHIIANPEKYFVLASISAAEYTSPSSFGGLPGQDKELGVTDLLPQVTFRAVKEAYGGILVLDDVMNANDQLLNALLNLAQFKETKNYYIGKMILASGNIAGVDGSLAKEIPTPLMNRLSVYITYLDKQDWEDYVKAHYMNFPLTRDMGVTEFLGKGENFAFYSTFPNEDTRGPFPSPRSWSNFIDKASLVVEQLEVGNLDLDVAINRITMIAQGTVGKVVADKLKPFYMTRYSKAYRLSNELVKHGRFTKENLTEINSFYKDGATPEETLFKELYKEELASRLSIEFKNRLSKPFNSNTKGQLQLKRITEDFNRLLGLNILDFINENDSLFTLINRLNGDVFLNYKEEDKYTFYTDKTEELYNSLDFGNKFKMLNAIQQKEFNKFVMNMVLGREIYPEVLKTFLLIINGLRPIKADNSDVTTFLTRFIALFFVNLKGVSTEVVSYKTEKEFLSSVLNNNHVMFTRPLQVLFTFYINLLNAKDFDKFSEAELSFETLEYETRKRVLNNIFYTFAKSYVSFVNNGHNYDVVEALKTNETLVEFINSINMENRFRTYQYGILSKEQVENGYKNVLEKDVEKFKDTHGKFKDMLTLVANNSADLAKAEDKSKVKSFPDIGKNVFMAISGINNERANYAKVYEDL